MRTGLTCEPKLIDAREPGPVVCTKNQLRSDHPWLSAFVSAIDTRLRRYHRVTEYTDRTNCIVRIQLDRMESDLVLGDGTNLRSNDQVITLHLWNEQLPRMFAKGPMLGWARRMCRDFDGSMRELARCLASRPDLQNVKALRTTVSIASATRCDQLSRIMGRLGFETMPAHGPPSWRELIHRLGENVLFSMMTYACNPVALRRDALRRSRTTLYLSRRSFQLRYATFGSPELVNPGLSNNRAGDI